MLKLFPLFADGAVLCRRKELRIFGEAEDGARVRCELRDGGGALLAEGEGKAAGGKFLILLPPQEAGTGCALRVTDGRESLEATDLCIGEVFLAGGQSNMELELQNADEGIGLIKEHSHPLVRYFNVPKCACFGEKRDAAWAKARWEEIRPGTGKDMSAAAYFFAVKLQEELGVPVGIVDSYWGGTSISCWMTEEWLRETAEGTRYLEQYRQRTEGISAERYREQVRDFEERQRSWNLAADRMRAERPDCLWSELEAALGPFPWEPPLGPESPFRPAGLVGTMIAPLAPVSLSGILYYQGETDATGTESEYDTLMSGLIIRWRGLFEDESLPFLFVQLPMWTEDGRGDTGTWPALRLAQSRTRDRIRGTGMICLLDQGEYNNIHPTNKRVVGERLCELAKRVVYGEQGREAPRVISRRIQGKQMILRADQKLGTPDGSAPALLELAGAEGAFSPAAATLEGNELTLTAEGVDFPLHARYAWTDYGAVNLFGENGLPLEPFAF